MTLIIRQIREEDMTQLVDLIHEAWFKGVYEGKKFEKAASAISLNKALYNSSLGRVAVLDGEIVGMILCSTKEADSIFRMYQLDFIDKLITLSNQAQPDEIERVIRVFQSERQAYNELIKGYEETFDASIEYIVVSEKARGKGVGKKLISEVLDRFKEQDLENVYLFTDTDCNYRFYDYLNFERINETRIKLPTKDGYRYRDEYMYAYSF
ncbi:GNAT family N-acetyltransferase [Facklamia miroungae]|uniref:Acetyltransferase (GNAT) family protein n=1 Tax=Facklamia miroungae TaxID=120956 RepID=A0A1G7TAP0_9LACT|nr:GNAT family N-acetyltransferase [Facklamia miroungae]NKZ29738.1 GNAT family N-acetyltransferase [Facklamia miroungae]SDG32281.1 Acetyltransferase (GNAT) family protein [Facklamia miroungae]